MPLKKGVEVAIELKTNSQLINFDFKIALLSGDE
jgi:hypothetical protein